MELAGKTIGFIVASVLLVIAVGIAAFVTQGFGMALNTRANNYQNHLFQHSYGTLAGDQAAMSSDFHALYQDASAYGWNSPAVKGDGNDICRVAANMAGGNFSTAPYTQWISNHCANGTLINVPSAH